MSHNVCYIQLIILADVRVKHDSVKLLVAANIPRSHAEKLQGQDTFPTGFEMRFPVHLVECEFTYGRVFGSTYSGHDTFAYLIPSEALEEKVSDAL